MNINIHKRSEWELNGQRVSGPSQNHGLIDYFIVHWPGVDKTSWPAMRTYIQNDQNYYLNNRGYSLGYNFLIGRDGTIWEARGFDFQNAANNGDKGDWATRNFNAVSVSCQVVCSASRPITDAQVLALRKLVTFCEEFYGRSLIVQGHGVTDWTTCPGDAINGRMDEIRERWSEPKPTPNPTPIPKEQLMESSIIRLRGEGATWVAFDGGKWWIPDGDTSKFVKGLIIWNRVLRGDKTPFKVHVCKTPAEFRGFGPVVGKNPSSRMVNGKKAIRRGRDEYGVRKGL